VSASLRPRRTELLARRHEIAPLDTPEHIPVRGLAKAAAVGQVDDVNAEAQAASQPFAVS
jgi:hypothetical protein